MGGSNADHSRLMVIKLRHADTEGNPCWLISSFLNRTTTMLPSVTTEKVTNLLPIYNFGNKRCLLMHSWKRSTNDTLLIILSTLPRRMDSMSTMLSLPVMDLLHWKCPVILSNRQRIFHQGKTQIDQNRIGIQSLQ